MLLPLDQIDPPQDDVRVRVDRAAVLELAASIEAIGLLQPIGVVAVEERYRVVFGRTRYLAHRELRRTEIEVRVLTPEQVSELEAAAAENVVRRGLSPVEEARALRQMIEVRGRSVRDAAGALGRSEAWVRARLELLHWPAEVLEAVAREAISVAVGRELTLVEDERVRAQYLGYAVESGVNAVQARAWRQEWELRRDLGGDPPAVDGSAAVVEPMRMPRAECVLCGEVHPVPSLMFVRLCGGCEEEVRVQGRRARRGVSSDGGAGTS
jgi:ParB/RepB/Spo0J family partition protein